MDIIKQLRAEARLYQGVQDIKNREHKARPKSILPIIAKAEEPLRGGLIKHRFNK